MSEKFEPTDGPWTLHEDGSIRCGLKTVINSDGILWNLGAGVGNAKLIAAAPEMNAALIALLKIVEESATRSPLNPSANKAIEDARAVIEKAKYVPPAKEDEYDCDKDGHLTGPDERCHFCGSSASISYPLSGERELKSEAILESLRRIKNNAQGRRWNTEENATQEACEGIIKECNDSLATRNEQIEIEERVRAALNGLLWKIRAKKLNHHFTQDELIAAEAALSASPVSASPIG